MQAVVGRLFAHMIDPMHWDSSVDATRFVQCLFSYSVFGTFPYVFNQAPVVIGNNSLCFRYPPFLIFAMSLPERLYAWGNNQWRSRIASTAGANGVEAFAASALRTKRELALLACQPENLEQ